MSKAKTSILALFILVGLVTPLLIQHKAKLRLIEENQSLRQKTAQLDLFKAEIEQLSNEVARIQAPAYSSDKPTGELLRLRGEVGLLREEKKRLETGMAELTARRNSESYATATNQSASFTLPKEAWSFQGYASPEAALQSAMWALREADVKTFLSSLTPEERMRLEETSSLGPEHSVLPDPPFRLNEITSYTIKKQENVSDDEVSFFLQVPEPKQEVKMPDGRTAVSLQVTAFDVTAKRLNGEWKLALKWDDSSRQ